MSLLTKASLIFTPNAYKVSTAYSVIPSDGSGDLVCARSSTATRVNSSGVVETLASNIPRLSYGKSLTDPSWLLEPQRTNVLLNSATLSTQSVTTTATTYTLSFYGTGTITLSGAYSATLVGTGTSSRVILTFLSTAASLTLTVSGSCTNAQLEVGVYETSYMPTTGSTFTRIKDVFSNSSMQNLIGQTEGVFYLEIANIFSEGVTHYWGISDGTINNRFGIGYNTGNNIAPTCTVAGSSVTLNLTYATIDSTQFIKVAIRYKVNDISLWVNGTKIGNTVTTSTLSWSNPLSRLGSDNYNVSSSTFYGRNKGVQLYKTYLSDAEMALLTSY